jgi:hypothetical protein
MDLTREEQFEQSKENLRKIFAKNPELKQAFKETIDEMSTPENIDKMAKDIHNAIKGFANIKNPIK